METDLEDELKVSLFVNEKLRARIAELEAALDVAANHLERVYTSDIWEADYKRYAEAARAALGEKE